MELIHYDINRKFLIKDYFIMDKNKNKINSQENKITVIQKIKLHYQKLIAQFKSPQISTSWFPSSSYP